MKNHKAAVVQLNSGLEVADNLACVEQLLAGSEVTNTDIILLPECFAMLGGSQAHLGADAETLRNWMASIAVKHNSWLVGGSIPVLEASDGRSHAACFVYSPAGDEVVCYHKMHLFDVQVADSKGSYQESSDFIPGNEPGLVDIEGVHVGLSICYDLRFPELYRHLTRQGARILCVPSAFTRVTGEAHWEPLLKARAIENQCYVLAANQVGRHPDGRETWGHSMIISPWGEVLAKVDIEEPAVIQAELDLGHLEQIRQQMPCLDHQRL